MKELEARRKAREALEARALTDGRELVLLDEYTEERPTAWVFAYDSALFIESGRREDRLVGNGPIYVHKETAVVTFLGTYASRERVISDYEDGLE